MKWSDYGLVFQIGTHAIFYWWGMLMDKVYSNNLRTEIKQKKK
jgi:hypothetical protein